MITLNLITGPRKRCTKCERVRPLMEFNMAAGTRDGRRLDCVRCSRAQQREIYLADRERRCAEGRRRYAEDPEPTRERSRVSYHENRMPGLAQAKARLSVANARRRANPVTNLADRIRNRLWRVLRSRGYVKRSQTFTMLGYDQRALYEHLRKFLDRPCSECGTMVTLANCHIDHIVPLATARTEAEVIELNRLVNLWLICGPCNLRKHAA